MNYTPERRFKGNIVGISITDNCVSSMLHRKLFGNTIRVLNRYYHKHMTFKEMKNVKLCRETPMIMLKEQTELAYKLGYKGVFFSRGGEHSRRRIERLYKAIQAKGYEGFKVDLNNRYNVCHNGDDCKQWIVWHGNLELERE